MRKQWNRTSMLQLAVAFVMLAFTSLPTGSAAQDNPKEGTAMDSQQLPDFISLWDFSDPAGTEQKFRELLPQAEESGDQLYLAELLTQIARTQGMQQEFAEAHRTLDRVAGMLASGDETEMIKGRLRYLLERGRTYNSSGIPDEAQPLFLEAWELGTSTGFDGLAIDAAHMLGIVTQGQESLDWNLKALSLAELTDDPRATGWKGALYNNIGWTYMEMHEPLRALELFQKGVDYREANEHPEDTLMVAHWTVARALRELGRHEEALEKLQYVADNFPGHSDDGFWQEEMAENLLATQGLDAARQYFEAALPMLEELGWVAESYPGRIERIREILGQGLPLLEVGSEAPAFELANQDAEAVSLAGLNSGGPVVLAFYKKDDTGG